MDGSNEMPLETALGAVESYAAGLRDDTAAKYRRACDRIREWYRSSGDDRLSRAVDDALVGTLDLPHDRQHVRDRYVFRALRIAEDAAAGRAPAARHQTPSTYKHDLDAAHRDLAERLIEGIGRTASDGTVHGVASSVRAFAGHLQALGIDGPCAIGARVVSDFLVAESASRAASMQGVAYALRLAWPHLRAMGYELPDDPVPTGVACRRERVIPAVGEDDLRSIMQSPDRSTGIGSRDYAILALASTTGMRACDVAGLRVADVDWRGRSVTFRQSKTGRALPMPLLPGTLRAMADYALGHRPETGCDRLFVLAVPPYGAMSASAVRDVLYRHVARSGVRKRPHDGLTFHGLRRSVGSWMLGAGSSADEIAQALGHSDLSTVRRYMEVSPDSMRACALGLDGIGCSAGGLS